MLSGALPDIKVQVSHETPFRNVQLRPVVPMILTTLAGFLAFVANRSLGSGSRSGSLTFYSGGGCQDVAIEVLPKTGNMTIISMLHVISFSFSWATLAVSVLSVSLYGVKTSTGVMSENARTGQRVRQGRQ